MSYRTVTVENNIQDVIDDLSLEKAVDYFRGLQKTYAGREIYIRSVTEYGCWGDRDRDVIVLEEIREETRYELEARMCAEQKAAQSTLEAKRLQLARLKKELGET